MEDPNKRFYCRKMRFDDMHEINELSFKHKFDYGVANLSVVLSEDTGNLSEVIVEKASGKIVAYCLNFYMSNGRMYGFKICVDGDYRSQLLSRLFTPFLDSYGNARNTSLSKFTFEKGKLEYKILIFNGMPRLPLDVSRLCDKADISKVLVENIIDDTLVPSLLEYESRVCPDVDRSKFIKEWVYPAKFPVEAHAVVAKMGTSVTGYAVLRKGWHRNGWILSPVYADSDQAAMAMIDSLLQFVKPNQQINFAFLAGSRIIHRLALELELSLDCPLYGLHPQAWPTLCFSYDRVYCTIQAWPM